MNEADPFTTFLLLFIFLFFACLADIISSKIKESNLKKVWVSRKILRDERKYLS